MPGSTSNMLYGVECAAAIEDGQLTEQDLLPWGQEIIGPGDGVAHGLQTGGLISRSAGKQRQSLPKPGQQRRGRQHHNPGRG